MWVDANFKESQLRHMRIGQPAKISADVYGGGVEFHGKVVGLGAGTGAAFALLPAQNATGNWIKVVQRVPVRIALDRRSWTSIRCGSACRPRSTSTFATTAAACWLRTARTQPAAQTNVYDTVASQADAEAARIIRANLGQHAARARADARCRLRMAATEDAAPALPPLHGARAGGADDRRRLRTFMEVLDMTIANVSVPHIAGSLGVSPSEGTWIDHLATRWPTRSCCR